MKKLIYIMNESVKKSVLEHYGINVPLYMTFDTEERFYNSPLWFEMYSNKDYINKEGSNQW